MPQPPQSSESSPSSVQKWVATIPEMIWAPFVTGFLILIVGGLGLLFRQAWLFPSLGPTIFLQAERPKLPTARFYNVVVGHLHGIIAGWLAVVLLNASSAPAVLSTDTLTPIRVWTAVLAVVLNMLLGLVLKASHPPAAATTLLFALGAFKPTLEDAITVMIGVLIIAIVGEGFRQLRRSKPS